MGSSREHIPQAPLILLTFSTLSLLLTRVHLPLVLETLSSLMNDPFVPQNKFLQN